MKKLQIAIKSGSNRRRFSHPPQDQVPIKTEAFLAPIYVVIAAYWSRHTTDSPIRSLCNLSKFLNLQIRMAVIYQPKKLNACQCFFTLPITFREGLEAFLMVAIATLYLRKTGRLALINAVRVGLGVALALSISLGMALAKVGASSPAWEGALALVAALAVIWCAIHMLKAGKHMGSESSLGWLAWTTLLYPIATYPRLKWGVLAALCGCSVLQHKAPTMRFLSFIQTAFRWLLLATILQTGMAMAQQEPTMKQIYAAAQSGKLDEAQVMVQQVLVAHPKSAKAHFVQSELYARQGNLPKAREALNTAEKLAPGLPFAKPEAVQALQKQLSAPRSFAVPATASATYDTPAAAKPSSSWMLPALLAAAVIGAAYFIFRRKPAQSFDQSNGFGNGLNGPQGFGNGTMQPGMQGGYGQQPMYGQPGYGQPAGSGIGGRIMGGVATGLAVGAGVMAAEAIGRNLMGNHETGARPVDSNSANNYESIGNGNADMGGQNFGVSDTSWDDAGSSDVGGGDWDN